MKYRPAIQGAARLTLASILFLGASTGCREAGLALGESSRQARANADGLLSALGSRFGPADTAPGYEEIRSSFGRSALIPSRLFNDGSVWSFGAGEERYLVIGGRPRGSRYLIGFQAGVPAPRVAGDYRRTTRLERLGRDQYEWEVRDELAVGSVLPDQLAAVLASLLHGAEPRAARSLRSAYEAELPRTTAALGRLFTLESAALSPTPDGGTLLSFEASVHPERIGGEFPDLSRFLGRYVGPTRLELIVRDVQGVRWWEANMVGDRLTLLAKVHDGALAPLEGPARRMPDRLRVHAAGATRIRIFNVGFSNLIGDVRLTRAPDRKAFTVRFVHEPDWHLPLLVERFIRTPLRRPFEEDGASLTFAARSSVGRTLLIREYELTVQESAILRWFGGLGSTALGEFREGAEEEYDRFNGEFFAALRADALGLLW